MDCLLNATAIHDGRRLQILDHKVHRIDSVKYSTNLTEHEMVVSNMRHFTIVVGVIDPAGKEIPITLKADLLYENGQPVTQLEGNKELLEGQTLAIVQNGQAQFRMRLNALSAYHSKRRFCIRITPADGEMLRREPNMIVVSTPMKSVTKSYRRTSDVIPEGEEMSTTGAAPMATMTATVKRKKLGNLEDTLDSQGEQLYLIRQILEQMRKKK